MLNGKLRQCFGDMGLIELLAQSLTLLWVWGGRGDLVLPSTNPGSPKKRSTGFKQLHSEEN